VLQIVTRICKLVVLPVAISLIIANLSKGDFDGAQKAVLLYVGFSLIMGIATPFVKYIGMLGENKSYRLITGNYFSRLVSADLDYFQSNLAGYLTTAIPKRNYFSVFPFSLIRCISAPMNCRSLLS